jgi:predicted secreted protein
VFKDAASDARIRMAYFNGEAPRFRLVIPGFGVMEGPFVISSSAIRANGEAGFPIRLVSAGVVTFEAVEAA